MEITIKGSAKEIADFAKGLQSQPTDKQSQIEAMIKSAEHYRNTKSQPL